MNGPEFDHFAQLVLARSGLVLTNNKGYLVRSRLDPVARSEGLEGAMELLVKLKKGAPEALIQRCVDAMATHESFFFRDVGPFEQMAETVFPELIALRQASRSLRIWCAACSSGQEPYSVAIILQEMGAKLAGWRVEILATDMSDAILQKAKAGRYSDFEVNRGLSPARLAQFFTAEAGGWQVSPTLRQMVQFRSHNLLQGAAGMGQFDVILCRNVLIYFDLERKRQILADLSRTLSSHGALFLGSAETVVGVSSEFEPTPGGRGLYRHAQTQLARPA